MNQPKRLGRSFGLVGTSIAALFGAVVLPVPASALASTELVAPPGSVLKTYHFDDIPVRSALQLLAEEGNFNLVVSDSVTGNITLHLEDVTWEQALAVVLRMKGLAQHVDGDTRSMDAG